jgi:hypothetical protein
MGFFLKKSGIINFEIYLSSEKYRFKYSTNFKINAKNWNKETQRPKLQRGDQGKVNAKITHVLNEYAQVLDELKDFHGKGLSKVIVKKEFDRHFKKIEEKQKETYSDYFKEYIKQKKENQSVKKDSWLAYSRIHDAILEFQKKEKTIYRLIDFNLAFFSKFIAYLRIDKKLTDNTLKRKIGFFKSFLNWCINNSYQVNMDFKKINIKPRETRHEHLTESELIVLENLELKEPKSYYRDIFLIGCYSGQRYSDYSRFNRKHISNNMIKIRAKKTGQYSYIVLNKRLKKLLDKYDWFLPKISSQKFNKNIQEICKIAGFNDIVVRERFYGSKKVTQEIPRYKLISSHTARRTFITVSGLKNVPKQVIKQATGIKEDRTLSNYIQIDEDQLNTTISDAWD